MKSLRLSMLSFSALVCVVSQLQAQAIAPHASAISKEGRLRSRLALDALRPALPQAAAARPSPFQPTPLRDHFLIKTRFDCSDVGLLEDDLKKVITSVGMTVDSQDLGAFRASLPDAPDSKDGDVVEVKMAWTIDNPGKSINVSLQYERFVWVRAATNELRRVEPEQAGRERFGKLQEAITKLHPTVAGVAIASPTAAATTSPKP